jgi:hypothetical protein
MALPPRFEDALVLAEQLQARAGDMRARCERA